LFVTDGSSIDLVVLGPICLAGQLLPDTMAVRVLQAVALVAPLSITTAQLSQVIWTDELPSTWKSSLRTHVAMARKLLKSVLVNVTIEGDEGVYRLQGDLGRVDVVRFKRILHDNRSEPDSNARQERLREAHRLWRGGPHWLSEDSLGLLRADVLFRQAQQVEVMLQRQRIADGNVASVVTDLFDRFREEPSIEWVAELLVEAQLASGMLHDAAEVLANHRTEVERTGLETGPGIQLLAQRLVSSCVREALLSADRNPRSGESGRLLASVQRKELESIGKTNYDGARILLVEGPAGIGKSTYLSDVARNLSATSHVLFGRAQDNMYPLQPIDDLLLPWRSYLAGSRIPIHELFLGLFDQPELGSIVVCIDDAHLLDLATVKLLRRTIDRGLARNVVLCLSARPAEGSPHVRRFLADVSTLTITKRVSLKPFTFDELTEFVRLRRPTLRVAEARMLAQRLLELSAGMPLLSELLLGADLSLDEAREDLATYLEAEIDELRPDHRRLLGIAALWGLQFDARGVAETAGVTIAVVFDAMEAGFRAALLEKRSGTQGRFRHELTKASLIASMGTRQKATLNSQIAEVLERRGGDVAVAAEHRARALVDATDGSSVRLLLNIARDLVAALRWDAAERLLRSIDEALQLQPWLAADDIRFDCTFLYAQAIQAGGDWRSARARFVEAFELARVVGDIDRMASVALVSYGSNQPLDGDAERLSWLRTVYDLSEPMSEVAIRAAADHVYLDSLNEFSEFGRALLKVLSEVLESDCSVRTKGFAFHGLLAVDVGDAEIERRQRLIERAFPNLESFEPEASATVLLIACAVNLQIGNLNESQGCLAKFRILSALRGRAGDRWIVHSSLATFAEWVGDTEEADRQLQTALHVAEQHDLPDALVSWLVFQVGRAMRTGDWTMLPPTPPPDDQFSDHPLDQLCLGLCLDAVSAHHAYSVDALHVALDRLQDADRSVVWLPLFVAVCVASTRQPAAAARCVELLRPYEGTVLMTPFLASACFGPADRLLASLALAMGKTEDATQWSQSSARLCVEAGLSGWDQPNSATVPT
jgi:DNA-binding SARP family transcriptional activator